MKVFQQEQQILDLQALNEELNHKINKYHLNNNHRINRPRFNCLIQKFNRNRYDDDVDVDEITYENDLDLFRVNSS